MKSLIELNDYLKLNPTPVVEIKGRLRETIKSRILERYISYEEFAGIMKINYYTFYNNLFESTEKKQIQT